MVGTQLKLEITPKEIRPVMPDDVAGELREIRAEMSLIKYSMSRLIEHLRAAIVAASDGSADVKMRDILQFTATHFDVPSIEILAARRSRGVRRPRQIAMYLCRTLTPRSFPEIALFFSHRDPSTVWHAIDQTTRLMEKDQKLSDEIRTLAAEILNAAKNGSS